MGIGNFDIDRYGRQAGSAIGVVPQEVNSDGFFTPRELLEFQSGLYRVPPAERRTDEILAAVHRAGLGIAYLTPEEGDLEDIFLVLISSKEAEA